MPLPPHHPCHCECTDVSRASATTRRPEILGRRAGAEMATSGGGEIRGTRPPMSRYSQIMGHLGAPEGEQGALLNDFGQTM
jgi:hypothetical protein